MNNYLDRLLAALEQIATAVTTIAGQDGTVPAPGPVPPVYVPEADGETAAEPQKRRRRRTKAEMEAARAAEAAGAKAEVIKAEPPKAEVVKAAAARTLDYDVLKASVIKLATGFGTEGRAAAVAILADYGVAKADQAPAEKWEEMNAKFTAKIAELDTAPEDEDEDFA